MIENEKEPIAAIIDEKNPWEQAELARATGLPFCFRPAIRSLWFLFFGLALGPTVIYFERDPGGEALWVILSLLCLGVIIHRLTMKYVITDRELKVCSWLGWGREEAVTLARIIEISPRQGLVGRLAGCSHLEIRSSDPDEAGLVILGQPDCWQLVKKIEELSARAREGGSNYGPG